MMRGSLNLQGFTDDAKENLKKRQLTVVFLLTAHLCGEDPTGACGPVVPLECRPALRCGGGSKAENLRAELLRAEHRKAEVMWEDMPEGARWVSSVKTLLSHSCPLYSQQC